ncbi:hypothetical protein IJV57_05425 [Candidatus Saccharibacteria bacterium]|nr:hypothetical protein [Candidatus Saccharibacteria bacterium]
MGIYFGISLLKTETNYGYNTAKLGERDIFALDGQFPECSEFWGWHGDLSIDYSSGIPLPKLTHSQTDYTYLVLVRCLRDGLAPSMITKPKDQHSEIIRYYERIHLFKNVFWDVLVFEAKKDDMFCYIGLNNLTLYMVSENGVKSFTSKTYDDLRECVLSDRTMSLSEKVKNSLNSFGPRYWCPVYPEK